MNLVDFLQEISAKNVELWIDGDKLRYRAPSNVLTPALLTEIKRHKVEIINLLKKQVGTAKTYPLLPIPRNVKLPLSFAQQRIWLLAQLEPNSAFYNTAMAARLSGQLNLAALERSLNEIMRRHEALRTNFTIVEGQPVQIVHCHRNITLPVVDLRSLPESEQLIQSQQLVTEEAQRPFDLATDLLERTTLLKLGETEHVLMLTMHHIVSDGWSFGVFVREVAALYPAFCKNLPSPLPELPIQYADFAVWQRQCLQGEVLESQLAYWKQQLKGAPTLLKLPTDRPRPAIQTFRGAQQYFSLSFEVSEALSSLGQKEGITLFTILLAGFQTLLYYYTRQSDIVVGLPIANRNHPHLEELIGFFINTLVLRTDLSGNPTFRELLGRVREITLGAYAHQDLPFDLLVEGLQSERNLSYNPLFQVMFMFQNAPMQSVELPGLTLQPQQIDNGTSKFDLKFSLWKSQEGINGLIEYKTDLFDATTIIQMTKHFEILLRHIVTQPEMRLNDLVAILTKVDKEQRRIKGKELETTSLQKLKLTKRKAVSADQYYPEL